MGELGLKGLENKGFLIGKLILHCSTFTDFSESMETSSACPSEEPASMFLTSVPLQSTHCSTYDYINDINDFEEEGEIDSESVRVCTKGWTPMDLC